MKQNKAFNRMLNIFFTIVLMTVIFICPAGKLWSEVNIDGTSGQRSQVANWLTYAVGTTVTIGNDGKLSVAAGGNKAAKRLRDMANSSTSVTIKIVENDPKVDIGRWIPTDTSVSIGSSFTTGTQEVDISDLKDLGNILNSYGITPGWAFMHEITEVFEGKKGKPLRDAHKEGVEAEKELMAEHNTPLCRPAVY